MKHRLLCCLEHLVSAMEEKSALPETVCDVNDGIRFQKPRAEVLCKGYSFRNLASESSLASMLLGVCIGLTMFDFATKLYHLRALLDVALIRSAVDLLKEYKSGSSMKDWEVNT